MATKTKMFTLIFLNNIIHTQNTNHGNEHPVCSFCAGLLCKSLVFRPTQSSFWCVFPQFLLFVVCLFSKNIFQFLSKLNNIMAHLLFLTLILNWLMEIKTGATTSKTQAFGKYFLSSFMFLLIFFSTFFNPFSVRRSVDTKIHCQSTSSLWTLFSQEILKRNLLHLTISFNHNMIHSVPRGALKKNCFFFRNIS